MRLASIGLMALVPLISALSFPHLSPQEALSAADAFLNPSQSHAHETAATTLGYANDITLASVPNDEHVVLTSARHPVSRSSIFMLPANYRNIE